MPFHEPLSIGADIATGYTGFYNVQTSDPAVVANGATQDSQFPNGQPVQQSYGGETALRSLRAPCLKPSRASRATSSLRARRR